MSALELASQRGSRSIELGAPGHSGVGGAGRPPSSLVGTIHNLVANSVFCPRLDAKATNDPSGDQAGFVSSAATAVVWVSSATRLPSGARKTSRAPRGPRSVAAIRNSGCADFGCTGVGGPQPANIAIAKEKDPKAAREGLAVGLAPADETAPDAGNAPAAETAPDAGKAPAAQIAPAAEK